MELKRAWRLAGIAAALASVAACSSTAARPQPASSPPSSADLAVSCQELAASDRTTVPKLTFDAAKAQAGSAVPLCLVPKPSAVANGFDGRARLEESPAERTKTAEWAEAISTDRPVPSGVAVSLSWDLYAFIDGAWHVARLTGTGTSA